MLKRNQLEVLLNLQLLASGVPLKAMTAVQAGFMGKALLLNLGVAEKRHSPIEEHPIFIGNFGMLYQLYPILVQTVASLQTLLQVLSPYSNPTPLLSIPFLCHWQVAVGTLLASPVVMFLGMGTGYWLHKDGNPWPFCASIQFVSCVNVLSSDTVHTQLMRINIIVDKIPYYIYMNIITLQGCNSCNCSSSTDSTN